MIETNFVGFGVECNGDLLTDQGNWEDVTETAVEDPGGLRETRRVYRSSGVQITVATTSYPGTLARSKSLVIENIGSRSINLRRLDTIYGGIPHGEYTLHHYASEWGREFSPRSEPLRGTKILQTARGRSSLDMHPWFALSAIDGRVIAATIAWSGNWIARFEPCALGYYRLSAGLSDWEFAATLEPSQQIKAADVIYIALESASLDDAAAEMRSLSRHWCAKSDVSEAMPVVWNSWWPYEDADINEDVFKANVNICAGLGIEVCVLDAGWYGDTDANWWTLRGDWDRVNPRRFPSGIRALADYTRSCGMRFGIWCEIEACGKNARVVENHPELPALRDGQDLGYICLGHQANAEWAYDTLVSLIERYGAEWIKLDFNLDPMAGCNRIDHDHSVGDGLHAHYTGYYAVLDRIRANYPDIILENCSSGGLRVDLGILKHLHLSFLSDPDYSVHALEVHWGALSMLHSTACYKFSWSETKNGQIGSDAVLIHEDLSPRKLDYMLRIAMLGWFACSYKLPQWPQWCLERLESNIQFYKYTVRRFVRDAVVQRLTGQTLRDGGGDRWNAFLYVLPDKSEALLFIFRLPGADPIRTIKLEGLHEDREYNLKDVDTGSMSTASGRALMEEGLLFEDLEEEWSAVVQIKSVG